MHRNAGLAGADVIKVEKPTKGDQVDAIEDAKIDSYFVAQRQQAQRNNQNQNERGREICVS
jgi:crotonobetainyl-CoA:carnitine CoA-transferase CaiB-like acyl-CoA transferase